MSMLHLKMLFSGKQNKTKQITMLVCTSDMWPSCLDWIIRSQFVMLLNKWCQLDGSRCHGNSMETNYSCNCLVLLYLIRCNTIVSSTFHGLALYKHALTHLSLTKRGDGTLVFTLSYARRRLTASPNVAGTYDRDLVIFHPQFDTLSPSCKSWTSLGTMGSGATELLGLLKGGSPFIWGHYNSTKACGCLHTQRTEDEWAALTLHTCTDKSTRSAEGEPCHVWSPRTNGAKYLTIQKTELLTIYFSVL